MSFKLGSICILWELRHPYGKSIIVFLNFYDNVEMPDKTLSIILMTQIQILTCNANSYIYLHNYTDATQSYF